MLGLEVFDCSSVSRSPVYIPMKKLLQVRCDRIRGLPTIVVSPIDSVHRHDLRRDTLGAARASS